MPIVTLHIALLAALCGCATPGPSPMASDPPRLVAQVEPAGRDDAGEGQNDAELDALELLTRLERADAELETFSATIVYRKWDPVLGRNEIRTGQLLYVSRGDLRRFGILLEKVIIGPTQRDEQTDYIFDGSWLIEVDHRRKLFIKREVVPPGQRLNPLRLGQGPFPLPIGQPKHEVLAQFDVVAINAITDPWLVDRLARVGQWEGLRLTPKPETPHAKDYRSIEIAYDATTLLPIGVFAVELKGERKTVFLNDTKRNQPVDEARLRVKPPIDPGWQVDIQNWRDPRPRRNPPAAPDQD